MTGCILSRSSGSLHSLNQICPPFGFPCLYFLHRVSNAPYKTEYILYELHFLLVGWWRPTVAPGRWLKDTGKLEGSRYVWQKKGENVKRRRWQNCSRIGRVGEFWSFDKDIALYSSAYFRLEEQQNREHLRFSQFTWYLVDSECCLANFCSRKKEPNQVEHLLFCLLVAEDEPFSTSGLDIMSLKQTIFILR